MRRLRRLLLVIAVLAAVVIGLLAIPVLKTEFGCLGLPASAASPYASKLAPEFRRNEVNTYLTYPEWAIVHAYEDYAAVVRARSESRFNYASSVQNYWTSLCSLMHLASERGTITTEYKAMLYIIGTSFTAELAVKGIYEKTIGRLTEWVRGDSRIAEDEFALSVADDYAKFLRQTPWYEYPFATTLARFWSETPWHAVSMVRSIERRIALTLELGVKSVYAKGIAALAGLSPADLKIRSIVDSLDDKDAVADPRIKVVEKRADGTVVIETERYRVFTEILHGLAARGRDLVEIAGNDDVLVTYLAKREAPPLEEAVDGARLFAVPLQAREGWERRGADVKVSALLRLLRVARSDAVNFVFEHVYDY